MLTESAGIPFLKMSILQAIIDSMYPPSAEELKERRFIAWAKLDQRIRQEIVQKEALSAQREILKSLAK